MRYLDPDGRDIYPTFGSEALEPIYDDVPDEAPPETTNVNPLRTGGMVFIFLFCFSLQGSEVQPHIPPNYGVNDDGQIVSPSGICFNTAQQAWKYENNKSDWVRSNGYIPEKTLSVFWTGLGPDGAFIAEKWAIANGGKTLEMSLRESGIELPKYSDRTKPVWGEASKSFANSACGIVILLNQGFISDQSIWKNVEYDALKNNPKVDAIFIIDPETNNMNELWRR